MLHFFSGILSTFPPEFPSVQDKPDIPDIPAVELLRSSLEELLHTEDVQFLLVYPDFLSVSLGYQPATMAPAPISPSPPSTLSAKEAW